MTEKDETRAEVEEDKDAAKEDRAIRAEAKKQDDEARKKNEQAEHDAKVKAARTVFADDEAGPDGTVARRLAKPGEVTDASGNPDPYGDHVNVGTSFDLDIRPIAGLHPDYARSLGLPTGVSGVVENPNLPEPDAPPAPEDRRDAPVAKKPAAK